MIILSHRGYWKSKEEKNTEKAFRRSFSLGFGTETDVRDLAGVLVISHDPPSGGEMTCERFFQIYSEYSQSLFLAINIKSDGLQQKIRELLHKYDIANYFVFDMAVPDLLGYFDLNMCAYTRQSEYEQISTCYQKAQGIWLDEFYEHWINAEIICKHINNNKKVCIVSPELHGRDHIKAWTEYRQIERQTGIDTLSLCTDFPEEARLFFANGG